MVLGLAFLPPKGERESQQFAPKWIPRPRAIGTWGVTVYRTAHPATPLCRSLPPLPQTPGGGGAEKPKGNVRGGSAGSGAGMELRVPGRLWLLCCWWCCGAGPGAGPGATFTRTGPRSRERQEAAFRVPSARLRVCFFLALSCPKSGRGDRGQPALRLPGVPRPSALGRAGVSGPG